MIKYVCKKYLIYVLSLKSQRPDGVGVKISSHNFGLIRYRLLCTSFYLDFNFKICCYQNWKPTNFHFFLEFLLAELAERMKTKRSIFFITVEPYSQVLKEFLNKFSSWNPPQWGSRYRCRALSHKKRSDFRRLGIGKPQIQG